MRRDIDGDMVTRDEPVAVNHHCYAVLIRYTVVFTWRYC